MSDYDNSDEFIAKTQMVPTAFDQLQAVLHAQGGIKHQIMFAMQDRLLRKDFRESPAYTQGDPRIQFIRAVVRKCCTEMGISDPIFCDEVDNVAEREAEKKASELLDQRLGGAVSVLEMTHIFAALRRITKDTRFSFVLHDGRHLENVEIDGYDPLEVFIKQGTGLVLKIKFLEICSVSMLDMTWTLPTSSDSLILAPSAKAALEDQPASLESLRQANEEKLLRGIRTRPRLFLGKRIMREPYNMMEFLHSCTEWCQACDSFLQSREISPDHDQQLCRATALLVYQSFVCYEDFLSPDKLFQDAEQLEAILLEQLFRATKLSRDGINSVSVFPRIVEILMEQIKLCCNTSVNTPFNFNVRNTARVRSPAAQYAGIVDIPAAGQACNITTSQAEDLKQGKEVTVLVQETPNLLDFPQSGEDLFVFTDGDPSTEKIVRVKDIQPAEGLFLLTLHQTDTEREKFTGLTWYSLKAKSRKERREMPEPDQKNAGEKIPSCLEVLHYILATMEKMRGQGGKELHMNRLFEHFTCDPAYIIGILEELQMNRVVHSNDGVTIYILEENIEKYIDALSLADL